MRFTTVNHFKRTHDSMNFFFKATLFLLLCFMCCNCQPDQRDERKTLRLNFLSEANSLDPRYGYEIPANHLIKMLYEGLMRIAPDGHIQNGIAESYTISSDKKLYHFFLRKGSCWSNGEPVTAYDFEYAWKSIVDPTLPTQGATDFYPIKNVEAALKGSCPLDEMGVKALDDRTLMVELEYPAPYFLELTATSAYCPIYAKATEKDPVKPVENIFNGPFMIAERFPHKRTVLLKNRSYWNASSVSLDAIEIDIVPEVATQLALFEKGNSDWFGKPFAKLPLDAVPSLAQKNILHYFPESAVYWYFLNTEKFPFNHKKFRQAFALAINREAIVNHVLKEGEAAATSVNRGLSFFIDHDEEKALHIFQEALLESGLKESTFPAVKLSYCGIETNHRIASAVQQQWKEVLGIQVILDPQEWTTYYDNLSEGNFLIGGMSWHSRIRDPIYNLQLFKHAADRQNMSFWENIDYQIFIDHAVKESDEEKRKLLLVEAEKLLLEEMPVIPIYFLTTTYAKNPSLNNVYISEINEIDFTWASKDPSYTETN